MSSLQPNAPPDEPGPDRTGAAETGRVVEQAAEPATAARQTTALPPGALLQQLPAGLVGGFALQQLQIWQGQFPPPDAVERYEHVLPGAFNRIMAMAERQQEASIAGASEARRYLRQDARRGHWLGWSVTVVALGSAVACAIMGQPWVAGLLVAVPVMGVAKALVDSAKTPGSPAALSTAVKHAGDPRDAAALDPSSK